jgi:hypothetical protein
MKNQEGVHNHAYLPLVESTIIKWNHSSPPIYSKLNLYSSYSSLAGKKLYIYIYIYIMTTAIHAFTPEGARGCDIHNHFFIMRHCHSFPLILFINTIPPASIILTQISKKTLTRVSDASLKNWNSMHAWI